MIQGKDGIIAVAMFKQSRGADTEGTSRGIGISRGMGSTSRDQERRQSLWGQMPIGEHMWWEFQKFSSGCFYFLSKI